MNTINHEKNRQIQRCELEIMKIIDQICRKHNIEYFAVGGSVLGAIRHQGFIPWDDDIDIGMYRTDYEKFLKVASEELSKEYHIQNFHTEPATPFYFTKIRKNDTKFVEYYLRDVDIHHGIFVDIFPFDNVPNQKLLKKIQYRLTRIAYQLYLSKSLTTVCSSRFERKENKKTIVRRILHILLMPIPKSCLFKTMDWLSRLFNNNETTEISHISRRGLRVKRKDLYPIRYVKFENMEMAVPNDYDAYLKSQFGDYSVLPPIEKQYGHLPYLVEIGEEYQEE